MTEITDIEAGPTYGAAVLARAGHDGPVAIGLAGQPPAPADAAVAAGPGWLQVSRERWQELGDLPGLAVDLASLTALARHARAVAGAALSGPGHPGLLSVVVVAGPQSRRVGRCLDAVRTTVRGPVQVITAADAYAGARQAQGEQVVILRSDAVVAPGWVEGLTEAARGASGVAVACSRTGPWSVPAPVATRPLLLRFAAQRRRDHRRRTRHGVDPGTVCVWLDRGVVAAAGGWAAGEDLGELVARLGGCAVAEEVYVDDDGGDVTLSACLIVRDEQAALPAALASLAPHVDEIVVCDTGSADRTVEVAAAFGARLVHRAWDDDFAAARNAALEAATGHWVISLDADELLEVHAPVGPLLTERVRVDAYGVAITNLQGSTERSRDSFVHVFPRLFRRERCRWAGRIHEDVVARDGAALPATATGALTILHAGYLEEVQHERGKGERNLRLAVAAAAADPTSWRAAYEVGRAHLNAGQVAEGERDLTAFLAAFPAMPETSWAHADAWRFLARARLGRRDPVGALEAVRRAHELEPTDRVVMALEVHCLRALGRTAEAEAVLDRLSTERAAQRWAFDLDAVEIPTLRGLLAADRGEAERARYLLSEVAGREPARFPSWLSLVELLRAADPTGWPAQVIRLAGGDADVLTRLAVELPPVAARVLGGALARVGRPVPVLPAPRLDPDLAQALQGRPAAVIAAAAKTNEQRHPELALQLWWHAQDRGDEAVLGQARCLSALDRGGEAAEMLTLLSGAPLGDADALFAAAVAVQAGAGEVAAALLSGPQLRAAHPQEVAVLLGAAGVTD